MPAAEMLAVVEAAKEYMEASVAQQQQAAQEAAAAAAAEREYWKQVNRAFIAP